MDRRLTDRTLVTELGQIIGTPLYMSPEQLEMCLDVDTRADVYSLGVMLYELLTGTLPRRADELLAQAATGGAHDAPPVPSLRVATLAGGADPTAALRQTDRDALRRELRGDLDWITMKAVAQDRAHRYETVNGLALDLQRALRNEPIAARAPTRRSRLTGRPSAWDAGFSERRARPWRGATCGLPSPSSRRATTRSSFRLMAFLL